jgi:hypothetical protein
MNMGPKHSIDAPPKTYMKFCVCKTDALGSVHMEWRYQRWSCSEADFRRNINDFLPYGNIIYHYTNHQIQLLENVGFPPVKVPWEENVSEEDSDPLHEEAQVLKAELEALKTGQKVMGEAEWAFFWCNKEHIPQMGNRVWKPLASVQDFIDMKKKAWESG